MVVLDHSGNVISEPIGRGKISAVAVKKLFENKIDDKVVACADSCRSFKSLQKETDSELVQLPKGKKKLGIYHLQHVNSFVIG